MEPIWNIDDVDPDIRGIAEEAARRSGVDLGTWLAGTIRAAAAQQPAPSPRVPVRPAGFAADFEAAADSGPALQAVFESLQKLSRRIESAEAKTTAAIAPLAEQVDQLAQQLDEVRTSAAVTTAPVERAVMRLSERLQKIENPDGGRKRRRGLFSLFG